MLRLSIPPRSPTSVEQLVAFACRNISARAAARAALERAVFKHEGANDEDLADADIDPRAMDCLLFDVSSRPTQ